MAGGERGGLTATLDVFVARGRGTPLTTSEVADWLDVSRRSAYDRLDRLADRGRVETNEVGSAAGCGGCRSATPGSPAPTDGDRLRRGPGPGRHRVARPPSPSSTAG